MIELLEAVAVAEPDRYAVVRDASTLTYGQLHALARACAVGLHRLGVARVAVHEPDVAHAVALLAGASMAGVEACLYPADSGAGEVAELARRFDHDVVIGPDAMPFAELSDSPAPPLAAATNRPHLVLTSGTTGAPRAVRHDWTRLVRATKRAPRPGERWLLAYGTHQFAALQVLMHAIGGGATLVVPDSLRPRDGLAAMRAHDVTHASATPTYWRFLLAELRAAAAPAPALQQATLGGEAIPAQLLTDLRDAFPHAAISQVYAGSEFGSCTSVRDGRPGLSTDVLRRGDDADVAMKIVDGELWVRSRVGMLGYHGEPPVDPDGWRPTGDLVEVEDDRIVFCGRASEIINVGGVKVHPLPIEEHIAAVDGVQLARVYGRPNALTGSIVAVEIVAAEGADHAGVEAAVRRSCAHLAAAWRPRSISFVSSVSMVGGKIVRRSARPA